MFRRSFCPEPSPTNAAHPTLLAHSILQELSSDCAANGTDRLQLSFRVDDPSGSHAGPSSSVTRAATETLATSGVMGDNRGVTLGANADTDNRISTRDA